MPIRHGYFDHMQAQSSHRARSRMQCANRWSDEVLPRSKDLCSSLVSPVLDQPCTAMANDCWRALNERDSL